MDRETVQLENWAAAVAADLKEERPEATAEDGRAERQATSLSRQRSGSYQPPKRSRQTDERESSPDDEEEEAGGDKERPRPKLPRPDKKEACPRCNSSDTKFCYYNNYNIKQPRFYCKTCQRYWTAGGTLRNIAPGSGRRKSKSKAASREQRNSPSLADHLTAAAAVAQTGMFGLPMAASAAYSSLSTAHLLAATDPTGLLTGSAATAATYAQHQHLLASHGGLAGLKLAGATQLPGQWPNGMGLAQDIGGSALDQLHGHMGAGASALAHIASSQQALEARALLNGHHQAREDLQGQGLSWRQIAAAQVNSLQQGGNGYAHREHIAQAPSRSASPQPAQQRQLSSPQQHNSQLSQQPASPPAAHQNGYASDDVDDIEVYYGRPVRVKADSVAAANGNGLGPASSLGLGSSLSSAQLAGLSLPPSMASLAAVMGPSGGASGMHQLLSQQDGGLDGNSGQLTRLQLLALQHQVAAQQELHGLLQGSAAAAALQTQHSLLQGLGQHNGSAIGAHSSAAAAAAALDPLQRSVGGAAHWLQGGGGASGGLQQAALNGNCGGGGAGWSGGAGSAWSLWSSYQNNPYALQAAAAAAFSNGR